MISNEIDKLIKAFKCEIESHEMCSSIGTGHENRVIIKYSASSLITGAGNHSTSCFCVYCEKQHPTWKCNTVTEVRSRKSILRSKGRCYLSLQIGHISRFCTSKYRCAKCQGRHNVSICEPKWKSEKTDSREIANNAVVKDSRNDSNNYCTSNDIGRKKNDFVQISNNVVESKKGRTFLMSAKGLVANEPMNRQLKVRVLFDQCAQKSFITEKVAGYLKLPCKRKEKMVVNAFGGTENQIVEYDIVQVSIMDLQGKKLGEVELYVVPIICKPICEQKIELAQATFKHLVSLKLADSTDGEDKLKIDVMIGANFYWKFVTTETVEAEYGPVAVKTKLGWV